MLAARQMRGCGVSTRLSPAHADAGIVTIAGTLVAENVAIEKKKLRDVLSVTTHQADVVFRRVDGDLGVALPGRQQAGPDSIALGPFETGFMR